VKKASTKRDRLYFVQLGTFATLADTYLILIVQSTSPFFLSSFANNTKLSKCNMRGQQCSFHLCLFVGHFAKKKIGNVASGRHEPSFSICQLSVFFFPTVIPAGYHKDTGAGFYARVSKNLVFLRSLRSLGL
jgi:hypothetical protein